MTASSLEQQLLTNDLARHAGRTPTQQAFGRFIRNKTAMAALVFILLVYFAGIFAPWVAPYGFNEQNLDRALQPPSIEHPMGTDRVGRDQLSRMIWGARTALIVSILAVAFGGTLGIVVGLVAGYYRGWVDAVIQRVSDVFFAFPSILLVILIAGTLRPRIVDTVRAMPQEDLSRAIIASGIIDFVVVFGALSLVSWPGLARFVRGQLLSLREREFVEAARALGADGGRIMRRHLLPNVAPYLIVLLSASLGAAVTAEVGLSLLGLGIQPPNPSWGRMILENIATLRTPQWYLLILPATIVSLFFVCFSLLGDGLNQALNPRGESRDFV